jgi:hypothetical protein
VLTLEEVQVHTMLTTVHDDAYSEYLDLKSMEEMRERVAGMPDATSRDWLKDDDGEPWSRP